MKSIIIIATEYSVPQAIADPHYLFNMVNQFLAHEGKSPIFDVKVAAFTHDVKLSQGLFTVKPDILIDEVESADLIIIPAVIGDFEKIIAANEKFIPWLIEQYNRGAELASLCVGAFMLASTGLLNGKKCSTHWGFTHEFGNMFPEVELVDGLIITEQERIYSSGGANSYWNLLLYLVEKHVSRDMAILAAKYFAIDIDRQTQAAFAIFQGQKSHLDEQILKAQTYIEEHFNEKITIEDLANNFDIARRSFERRFKQATNNSVHEYIQRIKIEVAKRRFEMSISTVAEVMYEVGYNDSKAFRNNFKKITGLTPVEYRHRYQKRRA